MSMHLNRLILRAAALALAAAAAMAAWPAAAQDNYPNRPIKLVVPYGAGGGTDQIARLMAEKLQQRLGQPVVVDNKPGAGTVIGSEYVSKQPADGYTLLLTTSGLTSAPVMMAKVPFDPVKSFTPIAPLAIMLISLTASNDVPASTVPELIAYMKAHPGKLNYASYGVATTNNLAMTLFNQRAGVQSTHVPYKAGAQALPDLVSGQVQLMFDSMQTSGPLIKAGKLKTLALATSARSPLMPDVPTVAEAGLPGFAFEPWFGLFGPAGLPAPIVNRLNKEIDSVLKEPEVLQAMRIQYLTPMPGSADKMRDLVRKDLAYWAAAAKVAGVQPE
ncbi:tripartite tricarboxylate transporter substrate binding protein [Variovorax sp. PBL-E5]|uniref:tripartite tricarboxylate transporter substrate binding protein n=1 Tax=Variovorax sp. PBL-E5 TaxID=434014 RepID=UPI001315D04B|nr:tripartite tricarboxylate transporter substrate binding protein [Variovorax sp. PBL-E5]VTU46102.1 Argininosuccinate lyase [Variovorax sp. PBL-E5]